MISGGLPFILAELAGRLVLSGAAADIRDRVVNELTIREKLVREIFSGYSFRSHERLPFFWLKLPEPWLSGTFKQAAFNEGVLIDDEDEFKAGRSQRVYHHVRVGLQRRCRQGRSLRRPADSPTASRRRPGGIRHLFLIPPAWIAWEIGQFPYRGFSAHGL